MTSPSGEPLNGVDIERVTAWIDDHIDGAEAPYDFTLIAGGHSNLTFKFTDANGSEYVLRRPPLGHVLASAHDMGREHRVISGLQTSAVPVAPALGICTDVEVNGAQFYVMSYVEGHVVHNIDEAQQMLAPAARTHASRSLVDTMAAIHAVDLEQAGLHELGRHEGYIARQLKRWYGQWNTGKTRELAAVDEAHDQLSRLIPEQGPATIVHGDYRLDNCMVDDDGNVVAVLDWEICTLGDPLADLGLLQVYWTRPPMTTIRPGTANATTAEGFWNRRQLAERYAEVSGRDISQLDFYVAFAYWKLACILEGVYGRYLGGALGDVPPSELEPFKLQVDAAAAMSISALERLR